MPNQPIDKGWAGPGLLADVLVNKYDDHLPLYRQSERLARHGIDIARQTPNTLQRDIQSLFPYNWKPQTF